MVTWTLTRARYEEIWETLHRRLGFLQNDAAKLPPCSVREPTDVSGEWWRESRPRGSHTGEWGGRVRALDEVGAGGKGSRSVVARWSLVVIVGCR